MPRDNRCMYILPFYKTNDLEVEYDIESNDNSSDNVNINTDCFDHYDQANLCEIDPDINYIGEENAMKCNQYYDINNFNMNYTNYNKLSPFLMNIGSLPDHFREMVTYLDCLNTKFKSTALTVTWLKITIPIIHYLIIILNRHLDQKLEVMEYVCVDPSHPKQWSRVKSFQHYGCFHKILGIF